MQKTKKFLEKIKCQESNSLQEKIFIENKALKDLKKKKYVEKGFLEPPKGEKNENWKKVERLIVYKVSRSE